PRPAGGRGARASGLKQPRGPSLPMKALLRLAIAGAGLTLVLFHGPALYARLRLNAAYIQYAGWLLNDPDGLAALPAHKALVQAFDQAMITAPALRQATRY